MYIPCSCPSIHSMPRCTDVWKSVLISPGLHLDPESHRISPRRNAESLAPSITLGACQCNLRVLVPYPKVHVGAITTRKIHWMPLDEANLTTNRESEVRLANWPPPERWESACFVKEAAVDELRHLPSC